MLKLEVKVMLDILPGMWLTSVNRCGGSCSAVSCHCAGLGSQYNLSFVQLATRLVGEPVCEHFVFIFVHQACWVVVFVFWRYLVFVCFCH